MCVCQDSIQCLGIEPLAHNKTLWQWHKFRSSSFHHTQTEDYFTAILKSNTVKCAYNRTARNWNLFLLQAGFISYRYQYLNFGKPVSWSFFTKIARFITDFIKYNLMPHFENSLFPSLVTSIIVPLPLSQALEVSWLSHLQTTPISNLALICHLLQVFSMLNFAWFYISVNLYLVLA